LNKKHWRCRIDKLGLAFFSIVKKIKDFILTKFVNFKDINWLHLPGFNIVINSILHQLVEFHITLYPQVLIDTMKIFINRPNVMNSFIQTMMSQIK